MKKNELKAIAKTARKAARVNIKQSLITGLTTIIAQLGHDAEALSKEIEKSAEKFSKKLSKKVKVDEASVTITEIVPAIESVELPAAEKPAKTKKRGNSKPAAAPKKIAKTKKTAKTAAPAE